MQVGHGLRIQHLVLRDLQIIGRAVNGLLQTFRARLVNIDGLLAGTQHLLAVDAVTQAKRNPRHRSRDHGDGGNRHQLTTMPIREPLRLRVRQGLVDATDRKPARRSRSGSVHFHQRKIIDRRGLIIMSSARRLHFRPFPELVSRHTSAFPSNIS